MASSLSHKTLVPWMRRWGFLPPFEPEPTSDEQTRRAAKLVAAVCFASIVFDVLLYLGLRNLAEISRSALEAFAAINITLLSGVILVVHLTQLRPARPIQAAWPWICCVMSLTAITWVQLTGVVTSYFIMAAMVQIVLFRAAFGWTSGMSALAVMVCAHYVAYGLEQFAILPRTSLLRIPPSGLDSIPAFRAAAMSSIAMMYVVAFLGTSTVVQRLRAQRRELERVRREMIGMAQGVKQGRLSGTEVGRWFIDELLGRGGTGEVYAAHDELGEQVAVKVLYPHLADDPRALSRFEREQEVASEISGHHFPKLYEVARADDGSPYIVMERLRGEDLGALLRRRKLLSIDECARLAREVGAALEALHARGIVHRDLTPGNVFLVASSETAWPDVRLLDLGMCKLQESEAALTQSSVIMGTPGYMAPEQIMGQAAKAGPECDVFAFGCILYRALTGEAAFAADTLVQAVESVCRKEPVWPASLRGELGPEVDDVFRCALAKRPEQRYPRAGEFVAAFASALESAGRVRSAG